MSKRPVDTNSSGTPGSFADAPPEKQARTDAATSSTPQAQKAALRNGIYLSKVEGLPDAYNENALSLRELISAINPIASIHFNYCCDPEFVVRQYPRRCVQMPISLVVGEGQYPRVKHLAQPYSNVSVHPARIPFQYCTHHSKLSILESETALHVIISTANVVSSGKLTHTLHPPKCHAFDWALKTQAFYHCIAPFRKDAAGAEKDVTQEPELSEKTERTESGKASCSSAPKLQLNSPKKLNGSEGQGSSSPHDCNWSAFRDDLLEYLDSAFPAKSRYGEPVNYWRDRILSGNADFSHVKDRIVATVPGRYDKKQAWKFGHLKLRKLLQEKFTPEELKSQKTRIGQFSSIGSLGPNPETWLVDEFLSSLSGQNAMVSAASSLKLIYPTVENVRTSLEGWEAGGSLPYSHKTHIRQPYLKQFLHQWKSDKWKRTRAMPHIKTYTALDANGVAQWLLVTSANLSHSAWGKFEKQRTQFFCRSYEMGVLICLKDHPEMAADGLPLPYDLPLTKYSDADQPFVCDVVYKQKDLMGSTWPPIGGGEP